MPKPYVLFKVKTNTNTATHKNGVIKSMRICQGPREINNELLSSVLAKISGEMLGFWLCTWGKWAPQFWQKTFSLGLMK
jgi:hypothetical protein